MKVIVLLLFGTIAWTTAQIVWNFQPSFAQRNCDRSYPDFCIAPPPPDLDCSDIPQKGFTVLPPDPHRFDRDKDGIGCEP